MDESGRFACSSEACLQIRTENKNPVQFFVLFVKIFNDY